MPMQKSGSDMVRQLPFGFETTDVSRSGMFFAVVFFFSVEC